ncbi:MAG TPA: CAP domain-containing protein [Kofleriaceae bacterium]
MRLLLLGWLVACGPTPSSTTTTITKTTHETSTMVGIAGPPLGDPGPPPATGTPEAQVLALVNDFRRRAGMPPVIYDNTLSQGCHEHAQYLVLNRSTHATYHLNAHHQDPKLPGATPAGAACGAHADLSHSVENIPDAVHGWMASLYHRQPVIAPYNGRIALGYAPRPGGNYAVALRFVLSPYDSRLYPVAFPGDGNTDVPVDFHSEVPNPLPRVPYAGHPFTLVFPAYDPITDVTATLVDDAGKPVPFFESTPQKPASQYSENNHGIVGIIPEKPLRAGVRYTASVTATWKGEKLTRTASFTTMPRRTVDASDEAGMRAALGKPALVRGTIKHASDISGVYHLTLHDSPLSKGITRVTVVVAGSHVKIPRAQLTGKKIEVEITPKIYLKSIQLDASLNGPGIWRFVK